MPQSKKMGRPAGPKDAVRGSILAIRLTDEEREVVDSAARAREVVASTWARELVLKAARKVLAKSES